MANRKKMDCCLNGNRPQHSVLTHGRNRQRTSTQRKGDLAAWAVARREGVMAISSDSMRTLFVLHVVFWPAVASADLGERPASTLFNSTASSSGSFEHRDLQAPGSEGWPLASRFISSQLEDVPEREMIRLRWHVVDKIIALLV